MPLVADMSSTILSRPIDVSRFGVIYAGAQKNIGPAGLVVVIVREDLLGRARAGPADRVRLEGHGRRRLDAEHARRPTAGTWPAPCSSGSSARAASRRWSGSTAPRPRSSTRAIDGSGFYRNPVAQDCRSWMNVPFTLPSDDLDKPFLEGAKAAGLVALEGHRSVGGMRASIYNAMPMAGVEALVEFMAEFQRKHG